MAEIVLDEDDADQHLDMAYDDNAGNNGHTDVDDDDVEH